MIYKSYYFVLNLVEKILIMIYLIHHHYLVFIYLSISHINIRILCFAINSPILFVICKFLILHLLKIPSLIQDLRDRSLYFTTLLTPSIPTDSRSA